MRRWLRGQPHDWAAVQLEARGITDPDVLAAMRAVPRERFVPQALRKWAYDDRALPIDKGQTISQPYIVARMTQALELPEWKAAHGGVSPKVLDVGTGSGYQAAVLAQMGMDVTSIELEPDLAADADALLTELGYSVEVLIGDGSLGAPEHAPFAGIVVAAAAPDVPEPLAAQLAAGGRLVIPIGNRHQQVLTIIRRDRDGYDRQLTEAAVFVPLLGEHGFNGH